MSRSFRKAFALRTASLLGWTIRFDPAPDRTLVIGAPHTSNFDAFAMILTMWSRERDFNFLVKDSVMKYPGLKQAVHALGGIPVNRRQHTGLIARLASAARGRDKLALCLTPKGTRGRREYWKSGFYRIAYETGLPISFGFVDRSTKTFGIGPTFTPTWDIAADMATIREFYDGKVGYRPANTCVPRLRAEDDPDAAAYLLRPVESPGGQEDSEAHAEGRGEKKDNRNDTGENNREDTGGEQG